MCNQVMKTRTLKRVKTEVHAPLREYVEGKTPLELSVAPIVNAGGMYESSSLLNSPYNKFVRYSDLAGMTVLMISRVGSFYYRDVVTIVGERGNYYIVTINGVHYSVSKSIVTFVRYENEHHQD